MEGVMPREDGRHGTMRRGLGNLYLFLFWAKHGVVFALPNVSVTSYHSRPYDAACLSKYKRWGPAHARD